MNKEKHFMLLLFNALKGYDLKNKELMPQMIPHDFPTEFMPTMSSLPLFSETVDISFLELEEIYRPHGTSS